jgi:hypothetical protein
MKILMVSFITTLLISLATLPNAQTIDTFSVSTSLNENGYNSVHLSKNALGMFEIEAVLDGKHKLLLALDNSNNSYFDSKSVKKLGYSLKNTTIQLQTGKKKEFVSTAEITDLKIGNAKTGPITINLCDFTERNYQLEALGCRKVDGFIGYDFLIQYNGILDFKEQVLYLRIK